MKQKFYLAIVNREYKGESNFYTASPICTNQEDAEKFLSKEYERLSEEFSGFEGWDIAKEDTSFSCIDYHNYNLWGWVEEIEVESDFTGHRFAYTIFSTQYVDGKEDNDELAVEIVFTDEQQCQDKVYQEIDKIVEKFKAENPSEDYGETDKEYLVAQWSKIASFTNDDEDGEINIWFEIHDII